MEKGKWLKKLFAPVAFGLVLVGLILSPSTIFAAETDSDFPDVPKYHKYSYLISDLVEMDVVNGYPDGEFKMGNHMLRSESAKIIGELLDIPTSTEKVPFVDVEKGSWYEEYVNALYKAKIMQGYNKAFSPNKVITRAEFAQILVNAYDIPEADVDLPFSDVPKDAWYEDAVKRLYAKELVSGIGNNQFGPNEPIKRGDAVWLLANTDYAFGETLPKPFDLSIMHSNDTHARLDDVAKKVTAVKNVRAEKPDALLLDAGDVFSGTLYFNEFKGMADLQFMNLMGYDAMTFGNHEFDLGSSPDGHLALANFVKEAEFPFVSTNIDFSQDEHLAGLFNNNYSEGPENGKIYNGIVKEINGEKVGIFGLTTEETANISSPNKVIFENYLEEAEKAVEAFENMGIDKIVALTHIGYNDNAAVDNDLVLAANVDGIDIIVGGHSHTELEKPVVVDENEDGLAKNPTVIVQTGEYNNNLGTLDVRFDENGDVVYFDGMLIPIDEQEEDEEAAEMLKEYSAVVEELANQEIGAVALAKLENPRTGGDNSLPSVRKNETALGNLITDGMLAKAKEFDENVIMAFQNGGGIRAEIDEGPITVSEVMTVLPFGNTLSLIELTGADIKEAFEISFKNYPGENGGFLHVAGGKVEFDSSKPVGERVVSISYKNENGELVQIQDGETYVIATNYFTAKGGDGYTVFEKAFSEGRVTDLGLSDWENFRDHLVSLGEIEPKTEGRIVDIAK